MAHSDNPNDPDIIIDLWNNMMSGQAAFRREQLECRFGQQSQLPIMKSATRTGTRVPRRSRRIHHCLRVPPTSALYYKRARSTQPCPEMLHSYRLLLANPNDLTGLD
jgi:hypothetical protein